MTPNKAKTILKGSLQALLRSCGKYDVDFNELLGEFTEDSIDQVRGAHIERLKIRPEIITYRRI